MRLISRIAAFLVIAFCILLALANRTSVLFSLDPLPPAAEGLSVQIPLYMVIFTALFAGVLIGGLTVWWNNRARRISDITPPAPLIIGRDTL